MTEPERTWRKRAPVPLDEDFIVSTWLMSYSRSREGYHAGAMPKSQARTAFWDAHRPVVELLARSADVEVICDDEDPNVVYAWACTSGDVVHGCIVKREYERADPEGAREMVRELLGERLDRACPYTYFPYDLQLLKLLPRDWYPAAAWLAQNYGDQLARKVA